MRTEFKVIEKTELITGEVVEVTGKRIIPIYALKILIIKKISLIWVEAYPKGIVIIEGGEVGGELGAESVYLPFDEDRIDLNALSKTVPSLNDCLPNNHKNKYAPTGI